MRKKSDLYNTIMEQVAKEVKRSLNEVDDIAPVKQEVSGEVYIVRCDGMNKNSLDNLAKQLPAFDNYGAGSIRITCKTHEEVIKIVSLLVNANILDVENSLGQVPRIAIQKVNKNFVNDSVNESEGEDIRRTYMHLYKIKAPRQKAKLDIITRINNGEIKRNPTDIKFAMMETGLWNDRTEGQIQMDVNLIMRKTDFANAQAEAMEGDFITDFIYSKNNYEPGEVANGMDAAEKHIDWLRQHGLQVEVTEGRYSYKYHIHYSTKQQFNDLVQWMAWHCGYTDTVNNMCPRGDRKYFEDMIKSGKNTTW